MNFTYLLGFVLVSGAVKVFPVSYCSLARKLTRNKRARRARMTKWDLKSHHSRDRLLVRPDVGDRLGANRAIASRVTDQFATRPASRCFGQLLRVGPRPVRPSDGTVTRLEISFRHSGVSCSFLLFDSLANEREPTGKTFTTPLTSPNTNIHVKFIFPWSSPLNLLELMYMYVMTLIHSPHRISQSLFWIALHRRRRRSMRKRVGSAALTSRRSSSPLMG